MRMLFLNSYINEPRPVVLNQGQFCPQGDNGQCLETFLVIANAGVATDIQWLEARDAATHPYNAQDSPLL